MRVLRYKYTILYYTILLMTFFNIGLEAGKMRLIFQKNCAFVHPLKYSMYTLILNKKKEGSRSLNRLNGKQKKRKVRDL